MVRHVEAALLRVVLVLKVVASVVLVVGLAFILYDGIANGFEGQFAAWIGMIAYGSLALATGWRSPYCGALMFGIASVAGDRLDAATSLGSAGPGSRGALFFVPLVMTLVLAVTAICGVDMPRRERFDAT